MENKAAGKEKNEQILFKFSHESLPADVIFRLDKNLFNHQQWLPIKDLLQEFMLQEFHGSLEGAYRFIDVLPAGQKLCHFLSSNLGHELFGDERFHFNSDHPLYSYREIGAMLFSLQQRHWSISLTENFALPHFLKQSRIFMARVVAQILHYQGWIGLWGEKTDKDFFITKAHERSGQALFISLSEDIILFHGKIYPLQKYLNFKRRQMSGAATRMGQEEKLSFLINNLVFWNGSLLPKNYADRLRRLSVACEISFFKEEGRHPKKDMSV